jgi:hypothetical protein
MVNFATNHGKIHHRKSPFIFIFILLLSRYNKRLPARLKQWAGVRPAGFVFDGKPCKDNL